MKRRTWAPMTEAESSEAWASCAAQVLLGTAGADVRRFRTAPERVQALRLAAAALAFAGETDLAEDVGARLADLA